MLVHAVPLHSISPHREPQHGSPGIMQLLESCLYMPSEVLGRRLSSQPLTALLCLELRLDAMPANAGVVREGHLHREGGHLQLWRGFVGDLRWRSTPWQAAETLKVPSQAKASCRS